MESSVPKDGRRVLTKKETKPMARVNICQTHHGWKAAITQTVNIIWRLIILNRKINLISMNF